MMMICSLVVRVSVAERLLKWLIIGGSLSPPFASLAQTLSLQHGMREEKLGTSTLQGVKRTDPPPVPRKGDGHL
jgi:hypothetical protein